MRKSMLNDPKRIAYKNNRLEFYRVRAESALADEKINPSNKLLNDLCKISWKLEQSAYPSIWCVAERYARPHFDRMTKDEKRIDSAMTNLMSTLEESSPLVLEDIALKIADKGFSPEYANNFLSVLTGVIKENANTKNRQPATQGNVKHLPTVWSLEAWSPLKEIGLGMEPASRIIAKIFGGDANSKVIYQTIRNSEISMK